MTSFVTSADETRLAYDRSGDGPPLVVVSGMFCVRQTTEALARELAQHFTVFNYDRRGRGESGVTSPYAVAREVEDLAALLVEAGGTAAVYGHSSGAGLALHAAARGLPITRLVLHEPPYGGDDDESVAHARAMAEGIREALADDRPADAIKVFFADSGMPAEVVDAMGADPAMRAVAPTMVYDLEVMGDFEGGTIPEVLVRSIEVPTMVLAGGASPDFFRDTASRVAELLPDGVLRVLDGQDHGAPADVVAPVVTEFLRASTPR